MPASVTTAVLHSKYGNIFRLRNFVTQTISLWPRLEDIAEKCREKAAQTDDCDH